MVLVGGFWGVDGCVWGYSRENEVNASFGWRDMGAWDWGFSQALSGVGWRIFWGWKRCWEWVAFGGVGGGFWGCSHGNEVAALWGRAGYGRVRLGILAGFVRGGMRAHGEAGW